MSLLCQTCAGGDLPANLDKCALVSPRNTGEFFAFVKCDYQFTDVTDPLEWAAAIASGDVVPSVCGFWSKALPSQTAIDVACNKTVQIQEGVELVFRTGLISSDYKDQEFYKTLRDNAQFYRVIPFLCDGSSYVTDAYASAAVTVTGQSPGFEFSWIVPPDFTVDEGNAAIINWNFTLRISTPGIICRRDLPGIAGVLKNS